MRRGGLLVVSVFGFLAWAMMPGISSGQSLKTVFVPEPPNLSSFVRDRAAAIQLGKALFWDMQVGSDGIQACGSCHFHAGADNRTRNAVNPGTRRQDSFFCKGAPNLTLSTVDYPFHKLSNPDFMNSGVISDCNDITASQGVVLKKFADIQPGNPVELSTPVADPVFTIAGANIRRVTSRNAPSVINAAYNFSNFWDGRANNVFNGANPFGPADDVPKIVVNSAAGLTPALIRIRNASLASQATGPPTSNFEMSWAGRTWPKIGKKMLSLQPLAKQVVHPQDSVLGPLANSTATARATGLNTTYAALIQRAFVPRYWSNATQMVTFDAAGVPTISPRPAGPLTTNQYTQMEANFSFFFGLAVQLYESTLIANDSKFDRVLEGVSAFTQQEQLGFATFAGAGGCINCHVGPELTEHSVSALISPVLPRGALPNPNINPPRAIAFIALLNGAAFYDEGISNISVTLTADDYGRGGYSPFPNPLLPGTNIPLSFSKLALLKLDGSLPVESATYAPGLPIGFVPADTISKPGRVMVNGAFKVPSIRNVELTGPYYHNGGMATLMQVVDFYTRGGNFTRANINNHNPALLPIGFLRNSPGRAAELVAFLLTLTDERVRWEMAPFDHPEIFVPNGAAADLSDIMLTIPEVGFSGRASEGLPALQPFLNVNHNAP